MYYGFPQGYYSLKGYFVMPLEGKSNVSAIALTLNLNLIYDIMTI